METQELKSIVEALIFAADEPLSEARLRETLELENGFDFGVLIEGLNQEYQSSGRVFTIRKIAGGYQIVTQQNYASWIKKLYLGRQKNRLSHAALETLALIAFKQPISRVDIGQIRGVNSDGVIGTLLERKLVTISGRSEAVGRPLLYSTTAEFLKYFGINDIADLPKPREIEELFSKEGMPEELLQALSQTDAQLSLPINGDGETSAAPDETENKIATAAALILPPVIIETPHAIEAPAEGDKIESLETVADSPAEAEKIESLEIVVDSPIETEKTESLETVADSPAEAEKIESLEIVIDSPIETEKTESLETVVDSTAEAEKTESLETVADSPAEHIADGADTAPVAATPLLTPEIPAVDINEAVVTQLEAADKLEVALSLSAPTPAGENEIAWLSSNSDTVNAAEHFTGNELAIDDLTATANDLPTFAAVAEVVSDHSAEQPTTNELAIDDLTETANDLPPFAGVAEVVSDHSVEPSTTNELAIDDLTETVNDLPTFAGVSEVVSETLAVEAGGAADSEFEAKSSSLEALTEEMTADFARTDAVTGDREELSSESFVAGVAEVVAMVAETPALEVQVVETYDVGRAEVESPPELQSSAAEEVDGWMAEEFSPEEIVEPDFIRKSENFFLEEERHDLVAASDADASATVAESEPIVVSDAALSSVADEIFLNPEATENHFTTPEEPSLETPQSPEFLTLAEVPDETGNIETTPEQSTDVTVVDFPEPTIVDDIAVSGVLDEAANSPTFENTLLSAHEEFATIDAPIVNTEPAIDAQSFRDSEVTTANAPAVELRQEILAAPVFENEFFATPVTANVADEALAVENVESETIAPSPANVNFAPASHISSETTAMDAMTATTQEASLLENYNGRSTTLRERVVGWIKRTLNKLMTFIGAAPENE